MDEIKQAYNNLYQVLEQLRLTGAERRQLEHDLNLLYGNALDNREEENGGTD